MRTIKFRAWDAENKRMLAPVDLSSPIKYWMWLGKFDIPLMQFTGLLDKNGKEIWEGDVLSDGESRMAVKFENGAFIFDDDMYEDRNGDNVASWNSHFEVIGNIYSNPELIKN